MGDLHRLGVELDDLGGVFEVDRDVPLGVGDGQLGDAARREAADDLHRLGVDGGDVVGAVIEAQDAPADGLMGADVGPTVGLDLAEGLEVERGDGRVAAVAGEAAVQLRGEGDPVDARGVGDLADDLLGIQVDDDHAGRPGDVKAVGGVDLQEVPAPSPPTLIVRTLSKRARSGASSLGGIAGSRAAQRAIESRGIGLVFPGGMRVERKQTPGGEPGPRITVALRDRLS